MLRFFMSPHPTFGSYKQPTRWRVEASPYYWWWYALTLNDSYRQLCEEASANRLLPVPQTEGLRRVQQVHADFGDVRYSGCKYVAFARWWRERVNTNETRGEYLFAEPPRTQSVRALQTVDAAAAALGGGDVLLLAVPLAMQRQHIDRAIDKLLMQHLGKLQKGRQVRNPKLSQARYSLTKPVLPATLKKAFDVYDLRSAALAAGDKLSNDEVAKRVGIATTQKSVDTQSAYTQSEYRRVVSATISRHYKDAKDMIERAALGCFP
jgi:hypothetical protein